MPKKGKMSHEEDSRKGPNLQILIKYKDQPIRKRDAELTFSFNEWFQINESKF